MIISKDTLLIDDPNELGELYREYAFVEDYGCYSCFDLLPEFKEVKLNNAPYCIQHEFDYCIDDGWIEPVVFTNGNLWVAWAWDGDGHLMFFEERVGKAVSNNDCKKAHSWLWIK